NPFIDVTEAGTAPDGDRLLTVGIAAEADLRLGCNGWVALSDNSAQVDPRRTSILGAALSACLGATTAFHRLIGNHESPEGCFSLWDYGRSSTAQGPEITGSLDVGRVLQVGAGAVGCALDYWLAFIGLGGHWVVADGDIVAVSNLNRQLLFIALDAGFPDGP